MIELPEVMTLARQMDTELAGKRVAAAVRGNTPHKWVWYNREPAEFAERLVGQTVAGAHGRGKFMHVVLTSGDVLLMGEMGGRVLFYEADSPLPQKHHLLVGFADGTHLSVMVQGWGFVQLWGAAELAGQVYAARGVSPLGEEFTYERFRELVEAYEKPEQRSIKEFLVQEPCIAGIGNGYLQDLLFLAGLHPRRKVAAVTAAERQGLYQALRATLEEALERGGRDTERDLYDRPGGYVPVLDRRAAGKPCPRCGRPIEKIAYLGGSCYFCPSCQT